MPVTLIDREAFDLAHPDDTPFRFVRGREPFDLDVGAVVRLGYQATDPPADLDDLRRHGSRAIAIVDAIEGEGDAVRYCGTVSARQEGHAVEPPAPGSSVTFGPANVIAIHSREPAFPTVFAAVAPLFELRVHTPLARLAWAWRAMVQSCRHGDAYDLDADLAEADPLDVLAAVDRETWRSEDPDARWVSQELWRLIGNRSARTAAGEFGTDARDEARGFVARLLGQDDAA